MKQDLDNGQRRLFRAWLKALNININKMRREFSDAAHVAQIIQKFYPKLVKLDFYPSRSSMRAKIETWELLNTQVLEKLGLRQSKSMIKNLVMSEMGAIECLLYDIMKQTNEYSKYLLKRTAIKKPMIRLVPNDSINEQGNNKASLLEIKGPQEMIPYALYEDMMKKSKAKDSNIKMANDEIARLENINKRDARYINGLLDQWSKLLLETIKKS